MLIFFSYVQFDIVIHANIIDEEYFGDTQQFWKTLIFTMYDNIL